MRQNNQLYFKVELVAVIKSQGKITVDGTTLLGLGTTAVKLLKKKETVQMLETTSGLPCSIWMICWPTHLPSQVLCRLWCSVCKQVSFWGLRHGQWCCFSWVKLEQCGSKISSVRFPKLLISVYDRLRICCVLHSKRQLQYSAAFAWDPIREVIFHMVLFVSRGWKTEPWLPSIPSLHFLQHCRGMKCKTWRRN